MCLPLIESVEEFYPDTCFGHHYGSVVAGALEQGEIEESSQLLAKYEAKPGLMSKGVATRYLNKLLTHRYLWPTFFAYLTKFKPVLEIKEVAAMLHWFDSDPENNWHGQLTKIDKNGRCTHCRQHLQPQQVMTDSDFALLRDAVYENGLVRSDIFLSSNPDEVTKFERFMSNCRPYNIVIDGLNTVSLVNKKDRSYESLSILVDYLTDVMGYEVLVFGMSHLLKKRQLINDIAKKAQYFLLDSGSEDDPFMMIAALLGGPGTMVVTKDKLKDHRARLKSDDMKKIYNQWQQTHTLEPLFMSYNRKDGRMTP